MVENGLNRGWSLLDEADSLAEWCTALLGDYDMDQSSVLQRPVTVEQDRVGYTRLTRLYFFNSFYHIFLEI